jgi:hypothetical protein
VRKDIRDLVKRAVAQGWRVDERRGGSILLFSPDGETIVTLHRTPSDVNWHHRAIRKLREGGFDPDL